LLKETDQINLQTWKHQSSLVIPKRVMFFSDSMQE
jgi:hypothetical protein